MKGRRPTHIASPVKQVLPLVVPACLGWLDRHCMVRVWRELRKKGKIRCFAFSSCAKNCYCRTWWRLVREDSNHRYSTSKPIFYFPFFAYLRMIPCFFDYNLVSFVSRVCKEKPRASVLDMYDSVTNNIEDVFFLQRNLLCLYLFYLCLSWLLYFVFAGCFQFFYGGNNDRPEIP